MSIARRYNQPIAARKCCTAEKAVLTRKRSVVAHDCAALKLGVGDNREFIKERVLWLGKTQTMTVEYRYE